MSTTAAKQGAYGKVKLHKHSKLKQLLKPKEVFAALSLKFGSGLGGGKLGQGIAELIDRSDASIEDCDFCDYTLRKVSRSFAGVIAQLPNTSEQPLRLAIGIFYLALRALDTVEDDMDLTRFEQYVQEEDRIAAKQNNSKSTLEAKQRELRLFYRYFLSGDDKQVYKPIFGIGEGDEAKLLEEFDCVLRAHFALPLNAQKVIVAITKEMGEGMADYIARDLTNGTEDEEDFAQYCHIVAGTVGDGLTQLWAACKLESPTLVSRRDLWNKMGLFLQKTNIIRDYLEDLVDGRAFWPKSVWQQYVPNKEHGLGSLIQDSTQFQRMSCLNHLITDALELVPSCLDYLEELHCIPVIKFCSLPQVMAIATLSECYANPKVFTGVVKIRKGLAARLVMDCCGQTVGEDAAIEKQLRKGYLTWFKNCASDILSKIDSKDPNAVRTKKLCDDIIYQAKARAEVIKLNPSPLSKLVMLGNIVATIVFVALSAYFVQRSYHSHTKLPPLDQSFDATLIGIAFLSVAYLLAFAGLPFTLKS